MNRFEYIGLGFCSNDHLATVPFIPHDTKVRMISHAIMGGGPAANSTVCAASLGLSSAFVGTVGDDADGRMILDDFARQGVDSSMVKIRPRAQFTATAAKEVSIRLQGAVPLPRHPSPRPFRRDRSA